MVRDYDDDAVSGCVGLLLKLCIWMSLLPRILKIWGKFKGRNCVRNCFG
jgi:hypothetical protein